MFATEEQQKRKCLNHHESKKLSKRWTMISDNSFVPLKHTEDQSKTRLVSDPQLT